MSSQPVRTNQVEMCAAWAAEVHDDTQERPDKKAAHTHGRDRSVMSRWRTIGKGSPCYAALQYLLRLSADEAMRVAATFVSAARMTALRSRSTDDLIAMWWELGGTEVHKESADRALSAMPPHSWVWADHASAAERDASADLTIAAIERIFAARKVAPQTVAAYAGRAH